MKRIQVNILHAATSGAQALSKLLSNLHNSALASYGVQLSERSASLRRDLVAIVQGKNADEADVHAWEKKAIAQVVAEAEKRLNYIDIATVQAREDVCDKLARINEEIERVVNARTDLI